jgi:hypothetical protein
MSRLALCTDVLLLCVIAVRVCSEGARVVVADLSDKGGNETVDLIKKANGNALFIKTDVSKARLACM